MFIIARGWPFAAKSGPGPMPCKARATFPGIQLSNGLFVSRTARRSGHSTSNGNFIIWRKSISRNSSAETDWLLESWGFVLEAMANKHQALIGGVDWITKKWLLETFIESEGLSWDDPWLQSIDLEYHNIDPLRGLFFAVTPGKRIAEWNNSVRRSSATHLPPAIHARQVVPGRWLFFRIAIRLM